MDQMTNERLITATQNIWKVVDNFSCNGSTRRQLDEDWKTIIETLNKDLEEKQEQE